MKRFLALLLSCLMIVMVFASCSKKDDDKASDDLREQFLAKANEVTVTDDSVTFVDASGSETPITLPKNLKNVTILYGSFTTLWYEAGGTLTGVVGGSSSVELYNEFIGRDITQDEGVNVVATSSSGKKWNTENIIGADPKPELIIASTAMSGYTTIEGPAKAANIPVVAMKYDDFSDYFKWFKIFCNLTGHPELWDSVAMKTLDSVIATIEACPDENNPKVFSMFSSSKSLEANTKDTVVGAMIDQLKAKNIVDDWNNPDGGNRLTINLETVFAADPDIILVQCHGEVDDAKQMVAEIYGDNEVWNSLRAVKEGKVFYLERHLFHYKPNSHFAEAYQVLADILYPADK